MTQMKCGQMFLENKTLLSGFSKKRRKETCIFILILTMISSLCACGRKNTPIDTRCPTLVEKAEFYNSQMGDKEGPMGMKMSIEYIDSVYKMIQTIDETLTPPEKMKMIYGNMKQNLITNISSSVGAERREFLDMTIYRVTFEHVVKSKNTGKIIARTIVTPDEIAEALKHKHSKLDEIKVRVNTIKNTLPREMETGYTIKDITYADSIINIEIVVDESIKDFDEVIKFRTWLRADQAVTLGDLTVGLTFWEIAAQVPVGFDFHFVGTKEKNELHIAFSKNEVVKYNKMMNVVKDQQLK